MKITILILFIAIVGRSVISESQDVTAGLKTEFLQNGFQNVEISTLKSSDLYPPEFFNKSAPFIDLSFVLFRDTGWIRDQVLTHLKEIVRIYNSKTCQIMVRKVFIIESDAYLGIKDIDWASIYTLPYLKGADIEIAAQFPADLPRPVIALIRSVLYPVDSAYSAAEFKAGDNTSYVNSTWIPSKMNSAEYKTQLPPGYDPLAHELAHLLGNTGHNDLSEPNILNDDFKKINDQVLPEQCAAFKESNMVSHPSQN